MRSHLIAAQRAWEQHIEAVHPGRRDPASGQELHRDAASLRLQAQQQLDAEWVQLLWQRGFKHSNPQVRKKPN